MYSNVSLSVGVYVCLFVFVCALLYAHVQYCICFHVMCVCVFVHCVSVYVFLTSVFV